MNIHEYTSLKPVRVSEAWKKRNGYVFLNSYRGVILNRIQSKIWEYMDGNHTIQEIYQLLENIGVEEIKSFITTCEEIGFIEYIQEEKWDI